MASWHVWRLGWLGLVGGQCRSLGVAPNCQQGLLNGQIPIDADQAQLLNAACQVAYGPGN